MTTSELEQIRSTIQRVREEQFRELDSGFIDGVLDAEVAAGDDDAAALRSIRALVERLAASNGAD